MTLVKSYLHLKSQTNLLLFYRKIALMFVSYMLLRDKKKIVFISKIICSFALDNGH